MGNHQLHILRTQILLELKRGTAETRLGYLWWFIGPLLMAAIYYFLIKMVFERGGVDYHLFILTGLIVWQGFAKGVQAGSGALTSASGLILQTRIPLHYLVLAPVIANMIYVCIGLGIVLLLAPQGFTWLLLFLPVILIILTTFTYGLALITSILNVYAKDTKRALNFILRAWWFFSPILYSPELVFNSTRIPDWLKELFSINPFTTLIPMVRDIFLYQKMPILFNIPLLLISLSSLLVGSLFFYYYRTQVVKYLS